MIRLLFVAFLLSCAVPAGAAEVVVTTTTVVSAQEQAEVCARSGVLKNCRVLGHLREGLGFSTTSPEAAIRSSCFYQDAMRGRYRIVERGVAWSPVRRGWFACVRYEQ